MEKKNINNSDIIVGLDIGTTKVSIIIGRKNQYDKIEILGNGKALSSGVSRGIVSNIDKTVASIKLAIEEVEKKNDIKINEVFVGIAGQHIKSLQHRGEIVRDNVEIEIGQADIDKLKDNMFKLITIPGEDISLAIKKLWKQGLFSDISINISKIEEENIFLNISLKEHSKLAKFNFKGKIKKHDITELKEQLKLMRGRVLSDNLINNSIYKIELYFKDKGYNNIKVDYTHLNLCL